MWAKVGPILFLFEFMSSILVLIKNDDHLKSDDVSIESSMVCIF